MAGRPRQAHAEHVRASFSEDINGVELSTVARTSSEQYIFKLSCGHLQYKTMLHANRAALRCRICEGGGSEREGRLYELLSKIGLTFLVEVKLVRTERGKLWNGPQDVYVCDFDLIIQLDGEQHYTLLGGDGMYSTTSAQQAQADRTFDALCWDQGHRLLRLHWADEQWWEQWIREAGRRCGEEHRLKFVMYTTKYRGVQGCDSRFELAPSQYRTIGRRVL